MILNSKANVSPMTSVIKDLENLILNLLQYLFILSKGFSVTSVVSFDFLRSLFFVPLQDCYVQVKFKKIKRKSCS